ncbi:MAG TPA: sigma-70 family RNA polymerase sigma factor, partial [Acidimicrobiales bacterium]|nr:sigma-70 family RNA polymerase sigma factor [Acidimicrobiales bacterium]
MALRIDDVDLARDRALVERFQDGDPGAFDALYRRYFARLTRYCLKRVGDPAEAEEIAQEAFTRALRALPSFEGERRFYPWMTVIAGRLCVDVHRRRTRTEPSADIDLGTTEGGQERVIEAVDLELLGTAVERLAPRHREVLELRERDGWSYQQIADHYDVPMSTVEALLFRARKALKREFLAVAGSERSWVTLPVVGGVFRRVTAWRAKAAAWPASLPPAAGSVVAVVAVVTGMTVAAL